MFWLGMLVATGMPTMSLGVVSALGWLARAVHAVISFFERRQLIETGRMEVLNEQQAAAIRELRRADEVRTRLRGDADYRDRVRTAYTRDTPEPEPVLPTVRTDNDDSRRTGAFVGRDNVPDRHEQRTALGHVLPAAYEFVKPRRHVDCVHIHCTANNNSAFFGQLLRDTIYQVHRDFNFSDVGYHYLVDFEGTLIRGRPLEVIPASSRGNNTGALAICLHGLYVEDFTTKQFNTLRWLCYQIDKAYNGIRFRGHREMDNKLCPVFDYQKVLNLNSNGFVISWDGEESA